jgi:hypothetical protein
MYQSIWSFQKGVTKMKKNKNWLFMILGLMALLGFGQVAQADLSAVGPPDLADGFPAWYQDTNALGLIPCHSTTRSPTLPASFMCVLAGDVGFNVALPVVFPFNYPGEAFYWIATASAPLGSPFATFVKVAEFALEKSFANLAGTVTPGEQAVFARSRFRIDTPVAGTYTVTHPFGVKVFPNAPAALRGIDVTIDIPVEAPLDFTSALNGGIGPFLRWDTGYPIVIGNERFIGDPNVAHTVTGSPTGNNLVRVEGPPNAFGLGVNSVETNLFLVAGKLFNGGLPTPVSVTRASYSRAAGTALGQVDVFAVSLPTAALTVNATGVIPTWPMTGDGTGKFFAHIPVPSLNPVPATITVTADDSGNNPNNGLATTPPVALTDLVTITAANYDIETLGSETLTINAVSSDAFAPPTLTATGFGNLTAGTLAVITTAPPATVTVTSTAGGSDSQKVTVLTPNNEPALPPVARNDAARTQGTPIIISVLANDLAPGSTLNPATVAVVAQPVTGGTAAANVDGTITFTPTGGFTGTATFTYTVNNALGTTSNTATVTVTVQGAPVAVNDTAVTNMNTTTVINILANDTAAAGLLLNPSSVVITPPGVLHGTTSINPGTGAVTYAPTLSYFGPDSFTYTVRDNQGTISNPATVSISVAPPGPTVIDDFATTIQGRAVVIPVLANDLGALNFTTLAIETPPAQGSAVANPLNGTVTYTPPALFTGPVTFTYTVRNNLGFPPSNFFATVTVTVTPLTEIITIGKAEYNSRLRMWTVQGTTNAPAPPSNAMTIRVGSPVGTLLGTAAVDATGLWILNLVNSTIPYDGIVSVQSSYGTAVTSPVRLF